MNSNLEKFKKAMELLEEIAVQFPSKRWEGDCMFEDFRDSLTEEESKELTAIHEKGHWRPFSIFM